MVDLRLVEISHDRWRLVVELLNLRTFPFCTSFYFSLGSVCVCGRDADHVWIYDRPPEDTSIYVDSNTRIQILDTMLHLPNADKEQCAAFIVSFKTRKDIEV